ncbi:helix-turn-helix domain-containing protein [Sunxiuqinia indica]|uniref:helix-turn-helix domain-containing protein n=1 Tax=Sunxiuqinia indica TaxID=2692584 RepID=UPI001356DB04|nr:helix-turn-helix transcriptional regulator [Sunxiuqinia indica]
MNTRIKRFMDHQGITSSELADSIGVQRSNVTHVLHGRNKPSFQFISKMLEKYPEINAKWLIMGDGDMLEPGAPQSSPQLFPQNSPVSNVDSPPIKEEISTSSIKKPIEPILSENEQKQAETPDFAKKTEKTIERIVVFYTDQTFREYGPSK